MEEFAAEAQQEGIATRETSFGLGPARMRLRRHEKDVKYEALRVAGYILAWYSGICVDRTSVVTDSGKCGA
jgi:hypothetical protein